MRVQIPPHTDAWMRGDKYGEVVKTFTQSFTATSGYQGTREMVRVRLDKSRKVVIVKLKDCEVVS